MDDFSPLDDPILSKSKLKIIHLLANGHSLTRYDKYNHFGYLAEDTINNEFIIWLLKLGLDIDTLYFEEPNDPMDYGFSLLNHAIYGNNIKLVQYLLDHGIYMGNLGEYVFTTPLYVAADIGNIEIFQFLLDRGVLEYHNVSELLNSIDTQYGKLIQNYLKPTVTKKAQR